ncbi:hypothetical protein BGZ61DRAFT_458869 [Ilyonectria robusta]|uniref:uncharacterized protein n=1 Tax=Ilyonectria robusta TaxID=1079257 RepID=UPI001E8D25ED|nr:uncharacterized protein BGZ61DRAFT_458869 [Ilyonectria robusta]KAH8673136.1 hypothetical protein BGZ61DRAFT_458869 [Ilyonectria robusta]
MEYDSSSSGLEREHALLPKEGPISQFSVSICSCSSFAPKHHHNTITHLNSYPIQHLANNQPTNTPYPVPSIPPSRLHPITNSFSCCFFRAQTPNPSSTMVATCLTMPPVLSDS